MGLLEWFRSRKKRKSSDELRKERSGEVTDVKPKNKRAKKKDNGSTSWVPVGTEAFLKSALSSHTHQLKYANPPTSNRPVKKSCINECTL
jgi:hypothetical protein